MTLIYFLLILGLTVFIHELGHFIFAKKSGVYCYEFSLGMGPKLFSFRRKNDETVYSLRLLPIGGYVQMAGEEIEEDKNLPKEKQMQSKTVWQRFTIVVAGAFNNFILGIVLLFLIGLFYGSPETKPYIENVDVISGMFLSDRALHQEEILESIDLLNDVYICDRYIYSNVVYNFLIS